MSSVFLQDYFKLQTEWEEVAFEGEVRRFRHRYSREVAELRLLVGVPMRELDSFTSREAYTFPYCPRIYKCSMISNYFAGNEVWVDLVVLS